MLVEKIDKDFFIKDNKDSGFSNEALEVIYNFLENDEFYYEYYNGLVGNLFIEYTIDDYNKKYNKKHKSISEIQTLKTLLPIDDEYEANKSNRFVYVAEGE